jgi:hypothetical protein
MRGGASGDLRGCKNLVWFSMERFDFGSYFCSGLFPCFSTRYRRAWLSSACCHLRFLFGPLILVDVQSILELVLGFRVLLAFVFSANPNRRVVMCVLWVALVYFFGSKAAGRLGLIRFCKISVWFSSFLRPLGH